MPSDKITNTNMLSNKHLATELSIEEANHYYDKRMKEIMPSFYKASRNLDKSLNEVQRSIKEASDNVTNITYPLVASKYSLKFYV